MRHFLLFLVLIAPGFVLTWYLIMVRYSEISILDSLIVCCFWYRIDTWLICENGVFKTIRTFVRGVLRGLVMKNCVSFDWTITDTPVLPKTLVDLTSPCILTDENIKSVVLTWRKVPEFLIFISYTPINTLLYNTKLIWELDSDLKNMKLIKTF